MPIAGGRYKIPAFLDEPGLLQDFGSKITKQQQQFGFAVSLNQS